MADAPDTAGMEETAAAFTFFLNAFQTGMAALTRYTKAFTIPFLIAANNFQRVEYERFWCRMPHENLLAYLKLSTMNTELAGRAMQGTYAAMDHFRQKEIQQLVTASMEGDPSACLAFTRRMSRLIDRVAYDYPAAIDDVAREFGFHFENQPASARVDETDRFVLYQVLPTDTKTSPRSGGKPILIIPPFVLGANILSFLPGEERSYAHAFANKGVPTYIRVLKDIQTQPAVQKMTPEDDATDTARFCKKLLARHGKPVTLNGYCQGGYAALCDLLSTRLDGLVDALITCVAPMDGTRSKDLSDFLKKLPAAFNDLAYGSKMLANGNVVADGTLMGWIYKLKSIENNAPLLAMWRDMLLLDGVNGRKKPVNKAAAALNYWLLYERTDLPMEITRMSFASYNIPIDKEGTLPVKLFDTPLNLKRITARNIPWLICYGQQDDLVEPDTALAPLDYVGAEVAAFPKGHVAIATSWSHPDADYALHTRLPDQNARGPVRFQLDLEKELEAAAASTPRPSKPKVKTGDKKNKAGAKMQTGASKKTSSKAKATEKPQGSKKAETTHVGN